METADVETADKAAALLLVAEPERHADTSSQLASSQHARCRRGSSRIPISKDTGGKFACFPA